MDGPITRSLVFQRMQHEVLKSFQVLQSGRGALAKAAHVVRAKATYPDLLEIYAQADHLPQQSLDLLFAQLIASNWDSIASKRRPPTTGKLQRAVTCTVALLRTFQPLLLEHLALKDQLELSMLHEDYKQATEILDTHQRRLGRTIWELHWRIALVDVTQGESERRKFVDLIHNEAAGSVASAVARVLSYIFERSYPPSVLKHGVKNLYQDLDPLVRGMFELLVLGEWNEPISRMSDLIELIEVLPLIDRSILFTRIATRICTKDSEERRIVLRSLPRLYTARVPSEFNMLIEILLPQESALPRMSQESIVLWDHYVGGEYSNVIKTYEENKWKLGVDLTPIELTVKARIYSKSGVSISDNMCDTLQRNLHEVYSRENDYEKSLQELDRFSLKYPFRSLTPQLKSLLEHQSTGMLGDLCLRSALSSSHHSPRLLENASSYKINQDYLKALSATSTQSKALNFFCHLADGSMVVSKTADHGVPEVRVLYFMGFYSFKRGQYSDAIKHLKHFIAACQVDEEYCSAAFAVAEAKVLTVHVYERMNDACEAIRSLVDTYLDYPQNIKQSLMKRIYELAKLRRHECASLIEYPILASLSADDPHEVCMALKRFLRTANADLPSDLTSDKFSNFHGRLLFSLLFKVCSVEVLDSLPALDQQEKVEQQRLLILNYIAEEFPHSARAAETEKLRLIQESQLRAALDRIDENKVVLNLSSLREAEASEFSEIFARYRSQRELAESQVKSDINAAIERIAASSPKLVIVDTQTAELQIFKAYGNAFKSVRTLFLGSPHFGLEACLSGKIRHGILVEHLLKPLKSRHLFLTKEKFQREDVVSYWHGIYHGEEGKVIVDRITPIFEELTNKITAVAREVKEKWIQARTEAKNPEGLFDYSFDDLELKKAYHKSEHATIDKYIDSIFLTLSARTRKSLDVIRKKIIHDLRPLLTQAFNDAVSSVQSMAGAQWVRTALVAGRQDIENACDEMLRWFEGASGAMAEDVELDLVGATAIGMVEKLHPEIKDRHSLAVNSSFRIKGKHFDSLVHMVFFLLENGIKHSSVPADQYESIITMNAHGNYLGIRVQNIASGAEAADSAVEKINTRLNDLKGNLDPAKVIREGGSGFAKIIATVVYELDHGFPTILATRSEEHVVIQIETKTERLIA